MLAEVAAADGRSAASWVKKAVRLAYLEIGAPPTDVAKGVAQLEAAREAVHGADAWRKRWERNNPGKKWPVEEPNGADE